MPSPSKPITTWSIELDNPNLTIERERERERYYGKLVTALLDATSVAKRLYEQD